MNEPPHAKPDSLSDYLAAMSRAIFSAGMSWKVIEAKWDGTLEAFGGFDPKTVAAYNPDDLERLMADPRVVHNRKKIEAIVANAGEMLVLEREFGSFESYLSSFAENDDLVLDLHKRFGFLGDSVAHLFLWHVDFNPPAQQKWAHEHFGERHHAR